MVLKLIEPGAAYCVTDAQVRQWVPPRPADRAPAPRVRSLGVLEQLAEDGRIRKVQLEAGREIRLYWARWTMAFNAAVARYGATTVGAGGVPDPLTASALAARYKVWAGAAEARRVRGDLTALQLVLDLCLRDWTPWEMRQVYRVSDTRALRIVREELLTYGRLAGWRVDDREAA